MPEGIQRRPKVDIHLVPIIHPGAPQRAVVDLKSQRLDEVKPCSCGQTQARDVPGVRWDLWFDEDNMEHDLMIDEDAGVQRKNAPPGGDAF